MNSVVKIILFLLLYLPVTQTGYSQTMYVIEIYADGSEIPESSSLTGGIAFASPSDIIWQMTNERSGGVIGNCPTCEVCDDWNLVRDFYGTGGLWIVLNLQELEFISAFKVGDILTFNVSVNNTNHPLRGYSGTKSFTNDNSGFQTFAGAEGINLTGGNSRIDKK